MGSVTPDKQRAANRASYLKHGDARELLARMITYLEEADGNCEQVRASLPGVRQQ